MKTVLDILKQRELPYGLLQCDQGVYKIVKEVHLLTPDEFDNIFLGMGGFHTGKIVSASTEKFF